MKYKYEELNQNLKNKFFENLKVKYILQGKPNPEKEALEFLLRKKAKSVKTWRTLNYFFMLSIDNYRKKLGLEPFFDCKPYVDKKDLT